MRLKTLLLVVAHLLTTFRLRAFCQAFLLEHARADVLSIDAEAESLDGVVRVITAADVLANFVWDLFARTGLCLFL